MKNLYLIIINVILFLIFPGKTNIVFSEKLIEESQLLFTGPHQGREFQLMRLNLRGEEEVFSQQLLRSQQIYLSPDRLKVSALEPDSNIIVLDRNGGEIFQFNLDLHSAEEGQGWYSWGWQGTDKIVVSQVVNGTLKFYDVDLNVSPLRLTEIETLDDFFIWDITQKISAVELNDLYRFSPNFRYAMTPPVIYATSLDDFLSTTIFWDLQEKTAQAIEDTMSWWEVGTGFPAWSNSENAVVFNKIEADGDATIYIYDYESPPRRLTNLSCNRCFLNSVNHELAFLPHPRPLYRQKRGTPSARGEGARWVRTVL